MAWHVAPSTRRGRGARCQREQREENKRTPQEHHHHPVSSTQVRPWMAAIWNVEPQSWPTCAVMRSCAWLGSMTIFVATRPRARSGRAGSAGRSACAPAAREAAATAILPIVAALLVLGCRGSSAVFYTARQPKLSLCSSSGATSKHSKNSKHCVAQLSVARVRAQAFTPSVCKCHSSQLARYWRTPRGQCNSYERSCDKGGLRVQFALAIPTRPLCTASPKKRLHMALLPPFAVRAVPPGSAPVAACSGF